MSDRAAGSPDSYQTVTARASEIRWLGEPSGDALALLKAELAGILRSEGNAHRAWLSRVQYPGEERVRVALVIDGGAPAEQMARAIAPAAGEILDIDLLFFERIPQREVARFEKLPPFYDATAG